MTLEKEEMLRFRGILRPKVCLLGHKEWQNYVS